MLHHTASVSSATATCLAGGSAYTVRMLCSRSASLTRMTNGSSTTACLMVYLKKIGSKLGFEERRTAGAVQAGQAGGVGVSCGAPHTQMGETPGLCVRGPAHSCACCGRLLTPGELMQRVDKCAPGQPVTQTVPNQSAHLEHHALQAPPLRLPEVLVPAHDALRPAQHSTA